MESYERLHEEFSVRHSLDVEGSNQTPEDAAYLPLQFDIVKSLSAISCCLRRNAEEADNESLLFARCQSPAFASSALRREIFVVRFEIVSQ